MAREIISPEVRLKVLERDKYTCRHCGTKEGPFVMDHVYPYVKGGETSVRNLVTSCSLCNARKHSRVGVWPKPIGYFSPKPKINIVLIWGITDLIIATIGMANGGGFLAQYAFFAGVLLSVLGAYVGAIGKV